MIIPILKGQMSTVIVETTLGELGIKKENEENYICELTQDCRHVFFIPLFPLRSYWVIKSSNGNVVDNYEVLKRLESVESRFRTKKLLSWSGLIIFLLILFLPIGLFYLNEWNIKKKRENQMEAQNAQYLSILKSPSLSDYYTFYQEKNDTLEEGFYTYKINTIQFDSVQFALLYDEYVHGGYSSMSRELIEITIQNKIHNSFWIKKASLLQLFQNKDSKNSHSLSVTDNRDRKLILKFLSSIETVKGPHFNLQMGSYVGQNSYVVINEWFDTRIDSIEILTKDSYWEIPKGKIVHHNDSCLISIKGKGNAILRCSDSLGSYKIDLTNEKGILQINGMPEVYN